MTRIPYPGPRYLEDDGTWLEACPAWVLRHGRDGRPIGIRTRGVVGADASRRMLEIGNAARRLSDEELDALDIWVDAWRAIVCSLPGARLDLIYSMSHYAARHPHRPRWWPAAREMLVLARTLGGKR